MKKMILGLGMTIAIIFFSGCINGLSIEDVHNIEQQNDSDVMSAPILPLNTEEFEQFPQEAIQRNNEHTANKNSLAVTMFVHDITPSGLSFFFENTSERKYIYSPHYTLYIRRDNAWELVEPIIDNWGFHDIAYSILHNPKQK